MTQIMSRTLTAHSLIGTRDGINSDTRTFHFIWLQNHLSIYIFKFVSMQDRLGVKGKQFICKGMHKNILH